MTFSRSCFFDFWTCAKMVSIASVGVEDLASVHLLDLTLNPLYKIKFCSKAWKSSNDDKFDIISIKLTRIVRGCSAIFFAFHCTVTIFLSALYEATINKWITIIIVDNEVDNLYICSLYRTQVIVFLNQNLQWLLS